MPLADTSTCLQVRLAGMPGGSGIEFMSSIMATEHTVVPPSRPPKFPAEGQDLSSP
jgi:hypothetical protein